MSLNTDNRTISGKRLSAEYALAAHELGLQPADLARSVELAATVSFLPAPERIRLIQRVREDWSAA